MSVASFPGRLGTRLITCQCMRVKGKPLLPSLYCKQKSEVGMRLAPAGVAVLRRRVLAAGSSGVVGCPPCWGQGGKHSRGGRRTGRAIGSAHTPASSPHPTTCRGEGSSGWSEMHIPHTDWYPRAHDDAMHHALLTYYTDTCHTYTPQTHHTHHTHHTHTHTHTTHHTNTSFSLASFPGYAGLPTSGVPPVDVSW